MVLIIVFSAVNSFAQTTTTTITGTITDSADGMELPSVTVLEKGTSNGVTTDFDGNYTIKITKENAILEFSYLGYKTIEVPVDGQTKINGILETGSEALDGIVITAFGFEKKTKLKKN